MADHGHMTKEGPVVNHFDALIVRLERTSTLLDILAATFESFEAIRMLGLQCQNREPHLLAAFMTAVSAAADGTDAPRSNSLLRGYVNWRHIAVAGALAVGTVTSAAVCPRLPDLAA